MNYLDVGKGADGLSWNWFIDRIWTAGRPFFAARDLADDANLGFGTQGL